jgi:hypothetical protein
MRLKLCDILIVLFVVCVSGGIAFAVYGGRHGEAYAHINSAQDELFYALDVPHLVNVKGPLGTTVIRIADGFAQVIDSPCREKICVKSGKIHSPGEWIACLPNQVLITIEGREPSDVDARSY